jgi:methyl-accepting chemotaxis protein
MIEGKKEGVRNVVEMVYGNFLKFDSLARSGEMNLAQAKKEFINTIKTIRYGNNDYFWINDMTPVMIMHPFKPGLYGKDLPDFKDPHGKHLLMSFVAVCKNHGEGFVNYM